MKIRYIALFFMLFCSSVLAGQAGAGDGSSKTLFSLFVHDGGPIVWYVLIPMSVAMVFVVVLLFLSLGRGKLLPRGISEDIVDIARTNNGDNLAAKLDKNQDIVSRTLVRVIRKSQHIKPDRKYIHEIASEALNEQAVLLLRKIEWCGIIGNVAPMVGLFGTVYGIIQAFDILGTADGQPRHDQLAAKISIALVTTFWGLLIAIPSLLMHGVFRSRIEGIISEAAIEVETLLTKLTPHKDKEV